MVHHQLGWIIYLINAAWLVFIIARKRTIIFLPLDLVVRIGDSRSRTWIRVRDVLLEVSLGAHVIRIAVVEVVVEKV